MNLATTDWLLCAVLLFSMLLGAWRGLVHELMSLVAWVAAFALAQWLAQDAARMLPFLKDAAEKVQYAAGFALVGIVSLTGDRAAVTVLPLYLLAGAAVAIVAQTGDFFESWMKRRAGVKDSGHLIPGHGGLFDRTDGMIAVLFALGLFTLPGLLPG